METLKPSELDFEDIYKTHYRRVFSLCRYLLNSTERAEDAAHEVFLRVHTKLDSYNPALPLSTWLLKIASRVAEAAKEGGFLGIGGVPVSAAERAALDEITAALETRS